AEPHIEIALEIAKREIQANQHCMQGNLSHDQCDFTSSVTHYTAALKINPHHMESLANRASSYVAVGCFDLAIADTSRIIDLKEDDKSELSEVFYTRAEAFYHTKQYYDSLRDCDDALMFRPGFVEAHGLRGAVHNCLGNWSTATTDLTISIKKKQSVDALIQRGMSYMQMMELPLALLDLELAHKLDGQNQAVINLLSQVNLKSVELAQQAEASLLCWIDSRPPQEQDQEKNKKKKKRKKKNSQKTKTASPESDQKSPQPTPSPSPAPPPTPPSLPPTLRHNNKNNYNNNLNNKPPPIETTSTKKHVQFTNPLSPSPSPSPPSSPLTGGISGTLERDFFAVEVAAIVDTVIAVGTASVLGRKHKVSEQMCLAVAMQMQRQTKIGLLRALREQYIEDNMRNLFHQIHVEALVETAIAVGTASVLGKFKGGHDVSDELSEALAHQMETQTVNGLIRMKQRYVEENVKHVFENVPSSFVNTGRRFSWSHSNKMNKYKEDLEKFRLGGGES
ncbi:hypothetical protein ScalyP_jg5923, partial [Parmales sp. scaly parma]